MPSEPTIDTVRIHLTDEDGSHIGFLEFNLKAIETAYRRNLQRLIGKAMEGVTAEIDCTEMIRKIYNAMEEIENRERKQDG